MRIAIVKVAEIKSGTGSQFGKVSDGVLVGEDTGSGLAADQIDGTIKGDIILCRANVQEDLKIQKALDSEMITESDVSWEATRCDGMHGKGEHSDLSGGLSKFQDGVLNKKSVMLTVCQ